MPRKVGKMWVMCMRGIRNKVQHVSHEVFFSVRIVHLVVVMKYCARNSLHCITKACKRVC